MVIIDFLTLNVWKKTQILGNAFYGTPGINFENLISRQYQPWKDILLVDFEHRKFNFLDLEKFNVIL